MRKVALFLAIASLSITSLLLWLHNSKSDERPLAAVHRHDEAQKQTLTTKMAKPLSFTAASSKAHHSGSPHKSTPSSASPSHHINIDEPTPHWPEGTLMVEERTPLDPKGRFERTLILKTNFVHPLIRVEQSFQLKPSQRKAQLIGSRAMVADHILVRVDPSQSDAFEKAIVAKGLKTRQRFGNQGLALVEFNGLELTNMRQVMSLLNQGLVGVQSCEKDHLIQALSSPSDPDFNKLWGLNNDGSSGGSDDSDIDASEAWLITKGSRAVTVGVIDTGIDLQHPDLIDNLWINQNETPDNNIDDDGNGYIDDVHGYDFINNDPNPDDDNNHGSHCAGTIGASANDVGVVGVAWEVNLAALKFLDAFGFGTTSAAIAAIDYANNMDFDITSNSWGGGGYSQLLHDSIKFGGEQGQVFVAAAGNDSSNNDHFSSYPAGYQLDHIISVAASDHNDQIAYFSNYGLTSVDLFAPGVDVYSCTIGGLYQYFSGTSMATPHVAGSAVLIKSMAPQASPLEIKAQLLNHADPLPQFKDLCLSGARLNAHQSLISLNGTHLTIENSPFVPAGPGNDDPWINPGESHHFAFTLSNLGLTPTGNLNIAFNILPENANACSVELDVAQLAPLGPNQHHLFDQWKLLVSANVQESQDLELQIVINDDLGNTWTQNTPFSIFPELLFQGQVIDDKGIGVPFAKVNLTGRTDQSLNCDNDGFFSTTCIEGSYLASAQADHAGLNPSEELSFQMPPSVVDHVFTLGHASIDINPSHLSFNLDHGETSSQLIRIENQGTSPLNYTVKGDFSIASINHLSASTLGKAPHVKAYPSRQSQSFNKGDISQKRKLRPKKSLSSTSYQGDFIRFSISEVGTVDRFEYPIGSNHFYPFFPFTGFALHYRLSGTEISLINDGFLWGFNPPHASVLVNDEHRLEISYEFSSMDGSVAVLRRFHFDKHSSSLRIEDRIENRSSSSLEDLVFKRFVDTAIDGIPESEHRGFEHKNILYGKRERCFGFGTDGKALLRDINGWNDFHSKETFVDDPDGPLSMDAILIYHYEEQLLAPSRSFDIVTTLAGAEDKDELEEALDGQNPWLKLSQQKGTIAPGAHQDLIVEANTDKLSAGSYSTEINISHNVLHLNDLTIPVQLTVAGSPSFTLPTASLDFGKVFIGELHSQALTLGNDGSADLKLNMDWDSELFFCSHSNINIAAGSEEVLTLSYAPKTTHLDSATINFSSNDTQNPSASISLTGKGIGAPIAQLSPLLIEKNLTVGQKSEPLSLSLHNLGHSRLEFRLKDIVQKENDNAFRTNTSQPLKDQAQGNLKLHPNKLSKKERLEAAHHPQQWIVYFRNGQRELKPETLKTCGIFEQRTLAPSPDQKKGSRQLALVHCNHLMDESSCWKALETDPGVEWAEPNYIYRLLAQPNDPHFPLLWGMEDSSGGDIDAPEAWAIETGNPNVVVAVLDTGIDEQHEDLQQNLWVNPGEIEGDFIDNDGNGYIDDVHGWNFFDNSPSLFDDHGHGTHVSGTIAAVGNNGIGVAGVCWEARIATIKIFNAMGFTNSAAIIEAIAYLKRMDFRISNNSWGGGAFSQGIRDAIAELDDHLFVAAAGNDGLNNDIHPFYPSSYDLEQVISVASTSPNDILSDFSNFGQNTVDLSAPGTAIFSCYPGGDYGYMSGTSMASPHVAGACALLLSHKQLKAPVLKKTLLESCDLISSLSDFVPEGRRLNLHRALTESPSSLISLSPSSGNVEAGSLSQLTLELNSEGQSIGDLHYLIQIETNDPQQATLTANIILHIQGSSIISASTHQLDMGNLEVGKVSLHHLTLTNTGSANLNISELDWGSPHLQIANFPSVIGPQHSETLEITYIPIESETWSDTLKIKSDASNHPILEIGMSGFSYDNSHSIDFGNTVLNQSKSLLLDITNPKPFPLNPTFDAAHPMLAATLTPSVIPPFSSAILALSFTPHHLGLQQGALQLSDESCDFSCEITWKGDCSEGNLFSLNPLHLEHRSLSHEDLLLKLRLEHLSSANNAITTELSPNLGALAVTAPSSVISGKGAIDLLISNTATLNHGLLSGNIIITVAEHSLKDQKVVPINIEVLPNPMFDRDQLFWPSQLPFQVNEGEAQILQLSREGPWLPEISLELMPHYHRSGFHQWVDIPTHVHFEAGQQNSRPLIIDFAENQIFHDNVIVTLTSAPLDDLTLAPHETLDIELIENDTFVFSTQWTSLKLSKGSEVELRGRFNVGPWEPTPLKWEHFGSCEIDFYGEANVNRLNHSQTRRWIIKATTDLSDLDETLYIQWGSSESLKVPIKLIEREDAQQRVFFGHESLNVQEGQATSFYVGLFEPPTAPLYIHFTSPSEALQVILPQNPSIPKGWQQVIPFSVLAKDDTDHLNESHKLNIHLNDEFSGDIQVNTIDDDKLSLSSELDHLYLAPNESADIILKVKGQGNNSIELDQNFNPDIGALWLREALPLNLPSGDWIGSLKLHLERDSQINPLSNSTSLDFFLDQRLALKLPVTLITTDLHPEIFTPRLKHVQNIQEGETQRLSLSIGSADNIHPYEVRIIGGNGLSAQPSTLSFSDAVWPQSLDLTIKSSQDDDADSETYLLELYNPEHQHLTLIKTQDPDEQGLLIDTTKGSIKSNQTWSCNLRLKSKPKKDVHVLVSNHNPTAEVFNQQKGLIFTPENWKRPQSLLFQATGEQRYFDKTFFFEFYAAGLDSQSIELVLKSPLDNLNIENLILSEEKLYIEDHLKVTINLNQDTLLQDQVQLRLLESNTKLQLMWNGRQALANLKLSQTGNFTLMAEIIGQQGTQVTKSFEVTAHPLTPQMDLSALSPIMAHQLKEVSPHLDEQEGSSVLSELISTITSAEMIIASEAFLSTVNSGETKSFNSGQHAITVSHVQLSHEEIHLDKGSFPLSLSGVPEDHVIMVSSSPVALNDTSLKLPSGSIGQLFVFELRKEAEDIENGFDIKLRLKNMAKTGIISSLYVQGENGLFSPSDADISIENQDLIATMKHFSTFTLVEEALVTETNLQNDSGVQAETLPVEMATAETHQESESSFQTSVDSSITTPISNNPDHINKESATEGSAGGGGGGCLLNNTIKAIKLKDLLVRHR